MKPFVDLYNGHPCALIRVECIDLDLANSYAIIISERLNHMGIATHLHLPELKVKSNQNCDDLIVNISDELYIESKLVDDICNGVMNDKIIISNGFFARAVKNYLLFKSYELVFNPYEFIKDIIVPTVTLCIDYDEENESIKRHVRRSLINKSSHNVFVDINRNDDEIDHIISQLEEYLGRYLKHE